MAIDFTMPKLGLTMEEGTIVRWLVDDGAEIAAGAAALLIETDKVETEVEAPAAGRLRHLGDEGSSFKCGELIARIETGAEDGASGPVAATVPAGPGANGRPARLLASPNAKRVAARLGVDLAAVAGSGPGGRIVSEDVEAAAAASPAPAAAAASPASAPASSARPTFAAAKLAELVGVDLERAAIAPTGTGGTLSRRDVADHVRATVAGAGTTATGPVTTTIAATAAPLTQTPTQLIPMRGMRGTIANRMHASLRDMAQLTLTRDAEMDAVWADRERRRAEGTPPGFADYVVAAVAQALRVHPLVNSQLTADGIAVLPEIHLGLAVALDGGLVVPVVRHADRLRLDAIAAETTRLAEAARAGRLTLADTEGGTFSVTSLGAFGVDMFTPVINPPNAAILGVGRVRDEVVWADDGLRRARRMTLSLTWDHRVFDRVPAAEFCRTVAELLGDPRRLG